MIDFSILKNKIVECRRSSIRNIYDVIMHPKNGIGICDNKRNLHGDRSILYSSESDNIRYDNILRLSIEEQKKKSYRPSDFILVIKNHPNINLKVGDRLHPRGEAIYEVKNSYNLHKDLLHKNYVDINDKEYFKKIVKKNSKKLNIL